MLSLTLLIILVVNGSTVSDYFGLEDLLSPEDIALRKRVRGVMETHVAPVMTKVGFAKTCSLSSFSSILFRHVCKLYPWD